MRKLIPITSHPEVVGQIVNQFAFMILMSQPTDKNYDKLQKISLDDIFKKADEYFIEFTDVEDMIMADEVNLTEQITEFLKEWEAIVDVTAIQQNIHYQLLVLAGDSK